MTAEHDSQTTPEQDAQLDHLVDTRNISYSAAKMIMGLTVESPKSHLPGKPISHNKPSGHVQDFSGRADQYRGGMNPPQTPEAIAAFVEALPGITEFHDDLIQSELMEKIASGTLTPAGAQAEWMAYLQKRRR